ncbi:MAG: copper homeostasis protein CutC [Lachnospiraceae bacterium]
MAEICCGSYEDAKTAYLAGAKRVELNSALYLGGLTPSLGSLILTKKHTDLEVICMARPRGAGFFYSEDEFRVMLEDIELMLKYGADGIAFGFLLEDFTIDVTRTRLVTDLIHSYGKVAVFHRAIDVVKDYDEGVDTLISLGVDRILTSGQSPTALGGMEKIKALVVRVGNQIEVLPGSGLTVDNVADFIAVTKVTQVHSSCKHFLEDTTTKGDEVSFGYYPSPLEYEAVSKTNVESLLSKLL